MDEVIQIFQNFGFPIAVAVALFWQNNQLQKQHKEESDKMTTALHNNTLALTKLQDKIGG